MANRILLIDADSQIPNIALGKLSTYYKSQGCSVDFLRLKISYYPNKPKENHYIPTEKFDKVFCSVIFPGSTKYIFGSNVSFGGTGYNLTTVLPPEIESLPVDYSLWPNNDISYGFITRGCIHNCKFCVVPQKEGNIHQVSTINNIIHHKKVKFLDNNILAFPDHLKILKELVEKQIQCEFNQGLDIRLLTRENSLILSKLHYLGEYVFAFDNIKYLRVIKESLPLLFWRRPWQIKFFVYVHPDMPLNSTILRLDFLKQTKCLPYIMRDISCWSSPLQYFYTDLAAWANQPGFFKKLTFSEFLEKRHTNSQRIQDSLTCYTTALPPTTKLLFDN